MSAVESRYTADVVTVGETSVRVEVLKMRRRPEQTRPCRLVGVRIAAPIAAVATRLGPSGVRRLIEALQLAARDAFEGNEVDDATTATPEVSSRARRTRGTR